MQSFPNEFMLRDDSSFRGLLNYPSNNEDIAPHKRHRSYFNQVSFLVKSIKNNKITVRSASELFKKQDKYLVYTVERGFQNLPLKKIDLPSNEIFHLICKQGKSSYGIFHNQSRIVEERNIVRYKKLNGTQMHVIEPLFLVEARMDKIFYNVLKDKQQKVTIIHNVPFKNRTGIDFHPGFLPTANNIPNEKFEKSKLLKS